MRTWARIFILIGGGFAMCLLLLSYIPASYPPVSATNGGALPWQPKDSQGLGGNIAQKFGEELLEYGPGFMSRKIQRKNSVSNNSPSEDELKKMAPWDSRVFDKHVIPGGNYAADYDFKVKAPEVDADLVAKIQGYLSKVANVTFYCPKMETLGSYINRTKHKYLPLRDSWDKFYAGMSTCDLYRENDENIEQLLKDMATLPIQTATLHTGGTQVKVIATFENGKKAMMKPLRYGIGYQTNPNHFYFSDFERANAEIAAFHLDRLMGFRRAVPTTGRLVDLNDLKEKSERTLQKTFFISPVKNVCFVGKCDYYCETGFAICGRPDTIFASFQAFLPDEDHVPRDHVRSLYRRTYSKRNQLADWQTKNDYCVTKVMKKIPYATKLRRLPDFVDIYILDFLMGNLDRHHYEVLDVFDESAYPVHLDNGRGFGRAHEDDWGKDILAPLYQCCAIRPATLLKLFQFYKGPVHLSDAMRKSLSKDPMYPVLVPVFLEALDRRVEIVLRKVVNCVDVEHDGAWEEVIRNEFSDPNPEKEEEEESE